MITTHDKTLRRASGKQPLSRTALGVVAALVAVFGLATSVGTVRADDGVDRPPIQVLLSVTWEGNHLKPHNLEALEAFRAAHKINVLHLVSAGYFSKPDAQKEKVANAIRAALKPGDELGLHVVPWKSLTQAAGVVFRSTPTYWGNAINESECAVDCGVEVPLMIYPPEDIAKLIATSVRFFTENAFERPKTFSAGGWLASPEILEAARDRGFVYDISAVPPGLVKERLGQFPIYNWLKFRWNAINEFSSPYAIKTKTGTIVEIPLTTASADYLTPAQMFRTFQRMLERRRTKNEPILFHINLHQETAWEYLPRVAAILQKLFPQDAQRFPVKAVTLPLGQGTDLLDNL